MWRPSTAIMTGDAAGNSSTIPTQISTAQRTSRGLFGRRNILPLDGRKTHQRNLVDVERSRNAVVKTLGGTTLELNRQDFCRSSYGKFYADQIGRASCRERG